MPVCGKVDTLRMADCNEVEDCEKFERSVDTSHLCVVCDFNNGGCGSACGLHKNRVKPTPLGVGWIA